MFTQHVNTLACFLLVYRSVNVVIYYVLIMDRTTGYFNTLSYQHIGVHVNVLSVNNMQSLYEIIKLGDHQLIHKK